jgi:hypothetical protein
MHSDLHAIRKAVQELETMGVTIVDCREAGLGSDEPLATMRAICHQWKKPFREAYRAGQSFRQLGIVRNILSNAVMTQWAKKAKAGETGESMPKPASAATTKDADSDASGYGNIEQAIESISEQLFASKQKGTVLRVTLGEAHEILSSWEVNAFVRGGDASCIAIQRAVAARCSLAESAHKVRSGRTNGLLSALESAHVQAANIQEQVAKAKDRGDIDAAVNLSATSKRLLSLIDETEKLRA